MSYWTKECLEIANFKAQSRACCFVPNHTHMATSVLSFVVPTEGFTQISKKKKKVSPIRHHLESPSSPLSYSLFTFT